MDSNAAGSSDAGASDAKIAAVAAWRESGLFSDAERAAFAVAEGMTVTPTNVTDEIFAEAQRHFSTPQMVELVATAAMENYRARFNTAFGIEAGGYYKPKGESGGEAKSG